jgi:hypothetical protein
MIKFDDFRGKPVIIKSTNVQGTIRDVIRKRGSGGALAVRVMVEDLGGKIHELEPHLITLIHEPVN